MRYRPKIQWSNKSWTHNVFRFFELIFGRKVGVRAEISSWIENGRVYYFAHTFEGSCALLETQIREFFAKKSLKIHKVYIPQLAPVGLNKFNLPFIFAIAFDAKSDAGTPVANGGSSWTASWSHTCTGSNLSLVVGTLYSTTSAAVNVATYNSVTMTNGINRVDVYRISLDYLGSPSTGSHTVTISGNASVGNLYTGGAISFSGSNDYSPLDGTGFSTNTTDTTTTTTYNNTFIIDATIVNNGPGITKGSGQTNVFNYNVPAAKDFAMSYKQFATAGSCSMSWTGAGSNSRNAVAIGIAEYRSQNYNRSLSDSITNGASRSVTISRLFNASRTLSDSIMNGASRLVTIVKGISRTLSDSIINGASRLVTVTFLKKWINRVKNSTIWVNRNKT